MAKPKLVSKIEDYRIVFDIAASLATVVALLAFYWAAQSAKYSREAAVAAERSAAQEELSLQPLFVVAGTQDESRNYVKARAFNLSGTYLDVSIDEYSFMRLWEKKRDKYGTTEDSRSTLVDFYYWDVKDVNRRDATTTFTPFTSPTMQEYGADWRKAMGRDVDVSVSTIIRIKYRDILRKDRTIFFKLGGQHIKYEPNVDLTEKSELGKLELRAESLSNAEGQLCIDYYFDDQAWNRHLYDTYEQHAPRSAEAVSQLKKVHTELQPHQTDELLKVCG
jgi:hypothetical protein